MGKMARVNVARFSRGGQATYQDAPGLPRDLIHLVSLEGDQLTYRQVGECPMADADKYLVIVHGKVHGNHDGCSLPGYSQPTDSASVRGNSQ